MSYVHPAPKDRDLAKQYQTAAKNLIYFEERERDSGPKAPSKEAESLI